MPGRILIRIVLVAAFTAIVVMAVFGLFVESKDSKYERIKINNSRQSVISIMGKPDDAGPCDISTGTNDSTAMKRRKTQCAEMFRYTASPNVYIFYFDKDGQVLDKARQVSP
jgi:hypothetical protein